LIIYRLTDKIPVKIGDIKFLISPLSYKQKQEIYSKTKLNGGVETVDAMGMAFLGLKYAVKKVEGLKTMDGKVYEPEMDENGFLSDESVDEILQIESSGKLVQVVGKFLQGISDPGIEGVEVELGGESIKKK
jgi:hypothetical protein